MTRQAMNTTWRLARRPLEGWPSEGDFHLADERIPDVSENQFLTQTIYISLDPYQWGRRRSGTERVGDVCHSRTVSRVVQSRHPDYHEGDFVFNTNGWCEFGLSGEGIGEFGYMHTRKLDPSVAPISTALGVLGMLGLTAYSGLVIQCKPNPGETVVVSAASGGVGQVACQLASIYGCRTVGIASTKEKCDFLEDEIGVDESVSHLDGSFEDKLKRACPDGVDVYFENVGGKVYEAVLPLLNRGARVTQCGMISYYGDTSGADPAERWYAIGRRHFERANVSIFPLFVGNYVDGHQDEFLEKMKQWLTDGKMVYKEHIWEGIEIVPQAFAEMLRGRNFGKSLVRIGDDPARNGG